MVAGRELDESGVPGVDADDQPVEDPGVGEGEALELLVRCDSPDEAVVPTGEAVLGAVCVQHPSVPLAHEPVLGAPALCVQTVLPKGRGGQAAGGTVRARSSSGRRLAAAAGRQDLFGVVGPRHGQRSAHARHAQTRVPGSDGRAPVRATASELVSREALLGRRPVGRDQHEVAVGARQHGDLETPVRPGVPEAEALDVVVCRDHPDEHVAVCCEARGRLVRPEGPAALVEPQRIEDALEDPVQARGWDRPRCLLLHAAPVAARRRSSGR